MARPTTTKALVSDNGPISQPGAVLAGRFAVEEELGDSQWLGRDRLLDRPVVIQCHQVANRRTRATIERAFRAVGRLGVHAHIVTLFDAISEADCVYGIWEHAEGTAFGCIELPSIGIHGLLGIGQVAATVVSRAESWASPPAGRTTRSARVVLAEGSPPCQQDRSRGFGTLPQPGAAPIHSSTTLEWPDVQRSGEPTPL